MPPKKSYFSKGLVYPHDRQPGEDSLLAEGFDWPAIRSDAPPPSYSTPVPSAGDILAHSTEFIIQETGRTSRAQDALRTYLNETIDDADKIYCHSMQVQMDSSWSYWKHFFTNVLPMPDPNSVWYGLCHDAANAKRLCQTFLEDMVETSVEYRPTLDSEIWQPVRTLKTAKAVQSIWKVLVTKANLSVLREKRLQDPANSRLWSLVYTQQHRSTGPVAQITKWIASTLALKMGLNLDQGFTKREATEEDVLLLIKTVWTCPADIACLPRTRVAFHAALLLLSLGGFRPGSAMSIPYGDVVVGLIRLSNGQLRPIVTVTIRHQKRPLGVAKKSQDDVMDFTITLVECKPFCLASLLIGQALADDAFEGGFSSLHELLERPKLGNRRYLRLAWKKSMQASVIIDMTYPRFLQLWNRTQLVAGVRDEDQFRPYAIRVAAGNRIDACVTDSLRSYILSNSRSIFDKNYHARHIPVDLHKVNFGEAVADPASDEIQRLLRCATLRCDPNAPLYLTAEERQELEDRADMRAFRAHVIAVRNSEPVAGNVQSIKARTATYQVSWLLKYLTNLKIAENRKIYFETVDKLSALGESTAGLPVRGSPHPTGKVHLRRCGGSYIGKFMDSAELGGAERMYKYVELITTQETTP